MIVSLGQAGRAQFIMSIPQGVEAQGVYFLVMSAGNVRWSTNRDELEQATLGQNNGLPQAVLNGEVRRPWSGDIWAVSDTPGTIVQVICPLQSAYQKRGTQTARI